MLHIYKLSNRDKNHLKITTTRNCSSRSFFDKNLNEINYHFHKEEDSAKLSYARSLYLDCINGESQIKNIGSIIVNTSNTYENLTQLQKNEVELFVHNTLFQNNYKMEDIIDSNGNSKDYISQTFEEKDPQLYKTISSEVNSYINKNFEKYHNAKYFQDRKLNSGSFGSIYLYKSFNTDQKFVCKKPNRNNLISYHFINESNVTDEIGRIGAISRGIRRSKKGYDLNIRLSTPSVYKKGKTIDLEFFENGDLSRSHDSIDIYDFFKQTAKLENDLHQNGYIHRDIKPDNLLVGTDDKIRLADMDSVIKKEMNQPNRTFGTREFANTIWYSNPDNYIDKIDIYATAVSVIVYSIGYEKFSVISNNIKDTTLKQEINKIAKNLPDKHLGMILSNMLNNLYINTKEILTALDENPTVKDKKDLKIALSYLPSEKQIDDILNSLKKRNKICDKLTNGNNSYFFITKLLLEGEQNKLNKHIAKKLTQNIDNLNQNQIEHIIKISKKFDLNIFTTNSFIITKKSIDNQKSKNRSLEKLLKIKTTSPMYLRKSISI